MSSKITGLDLLAEWARTHLPAGNPTPDDLASMELIDLISALTMLRNHLPLLISTFEQLRATIPEHARDAMLSQTTPQQWVALAEFLEEPVEILTGLATLCRDQAQPETTQTKTTQGQIEAGPEKPQGRAV